MWKWVDQRDWGGERAGEVEGGVKSAELSQSQVKRQKSELTQNISFAPSASLNPSTSSPLRLKAVSQIILPDKLIAVELFRTTGSQNLSVSHNVRAIGNG